MAASGFARTFSGGLRRSTVAHFACKVRGTNIVAAKHAQKIQQGHAPDFATCSWPSLCEQSELPCCRPRLRNVSVALTLRAKRATMLSPQIFAMRPFPSLIHASIPSKIQSVFMEIAKCFIRLQKNFTIHRFAAASNAARGRRQCCSRPKVTLLAAASR